MARLLIPIDRGAAMTFRDLARDFSAQLGTWGYSTMTVSRYDRSLMQFLAFVKAQGGSDDVRSFNDRNVFDFASSLGTMVSPNTILNMLSAMRALARYGMTRRDVHNRRLIQEDPTQSFRWPQRQRVETEWARPEEIKKLVNERVPTYQAIARDIFVETGIRTGEAARLSIEHFRELSGRYFLAVNRKGRGQRRHVETRDVPISKGLGDAIRDWILARGDANRLEFPLLINSQGSRWKGSSLSNMIARLAVEAGISRFRVSAHKLRHSANVRDRIAGLDRFQRAQRHGHSSLQSQERYDHIMPGELYEATEKSFDLLQQWVGKPFPLEGESGDMERNSTEEIINADEEIRDQES